MLTSVKLDYKPRTVAIEISDIIINYFPAEKPNRITFQKIIPEMSFLLGHVFP